MTLRATATAVVLSCATSGSALAYDFSLKTFMGRMNRMLGQGGITCGAEADRHRQELLLDLDAIVGEARSAARAAIASLSGDRDAAVRNYRAHAENLRQQILRSQSAKESVVFDEQAGRLSAQLRSLVPSLSRGQATQAIRNDLQRVEAAAAAVSQEVNAAYDNCRKPLIPGSER